MDVSKVLQESDLFRGLDAAQLARVAVLAESRPFADGDAVVFEDQPGGELFVIASGRFEITISPPFGGGESQRICTLEPGELFGEVSLVDGFRRSATVRALGASHVVAIADDRLRRLMEEDAKIGYHVMRNLARVLAARIRDTNLKLRNTLSNLLY